MLGVVHAALCLPFETSPNISRQSFILRVFFFKDRDICIEMFYSELLLIECSEVEPGERMRKPLQRLHGIGQRSGKKAPPAPIPQPMRV